VNGPDALPGVDAYTAALDGAHRAAIYRPVAQWLLDIGYLTDWRPGVLPPTDVWAAVVDLVHEDAGGRFHGRELTREEVEAWLMGEAADGKPPNT
jgi:hypothetical protein